MTEEERKRRIRDSFLRVFTSDDGVIVLRELAEFALADRADFCADQRKADYLQGRRSVVMEIRNQLKEKEDE